jgi:hypothetical protein
VLAKKTVSDFGYPRVCRFRKYQKINRSSSLPLPTFSKRDLYCIKCSKNWPKLTKNGKILFFECNHSKTVCGVFQDLKNVKKDEKALLILANFSQFL